jgi:porphobilinogen synthase
MKKESTQKTCLENLTRRPRRLRRTEGLRRLVRESRVSVDNLIYPLFVTHGPKTEIDSMPGQFRWPVEELSKELQAIAALGIPAVLLFGLPEHKDEIGSGAWDPQGPVPQAVRAAKEAVPELVVITDVCLCQYTSHGHCGVLEESGRILNDETVELLARTALCYAEAGADMIAPSDMMDGRVGAIRRALDEGGFAETAIMAYSAKYASAFYGPFREAAACAPAFGDRRSHQLDPANRREALVEVALDLEEGADIVMVKPALAYLDVIREVRQLTQLPLAAYNVSGEYALVKAAAARGWIEERPLVLEILTAIRRAGADLIITYHAKDVAKWLSE